MRAALCLFLAAGSGCATFVGVEDAAFHLPRLDGDYLVSIDRLRADGTTRDMIVMRGQAHLDVDTRILDLSVGILPSGGGTALSETSITDIEFPADTDEVLYTINLSIPRGALPPAPAPEPASDDLTINTPVRFIAEDDYSFCAKKVDQGRDVTLGSVLVPDLANLPASDATCDDTLRN
jgi:hypothetical protein